ncbi:MAG TPA: ester cyclase [Steroidobacteraceae bacterium]|nr:ester cyclase [Steroidobacteraceae bacterium]
MTKPLLVVGVALLILAGCAAPAPPDYAAQAKPALDAFMARWSAGNLDGLDAAIAPNFQRHSPGGFVADGLPASKKVVTDLRTSFPDVKVVLEESDFMKDMSFHLWTFTGTNTGPGAMPPTGKSAKVSGTTRIRYQDGKIIDELVYFDALDFQQQLGFTLTPPASTPAAAST